MQYNSSLGDNIFTLKRKFQDSSAGTKKFKPSGKVSDASTIMDDEQAEFESLDSDSDFEGIKINRQVPIWARDVIKQWKEVNTKHDPDAIFAPIKTPQGSGFLCDLKQIFPQSKRVYEQRGDSGNWHLTKN